MDERERGRFVMSIALGPVGLFFGILALVAVLRGVLTPQVAEDAAIGVICGGAAMALMPRSMWRQGFRLMLGLLGILFAFAAAFVVIFVLTGSIAAGLLYLLGWIIEVVVGTRIVNRIAPPPSAARANTR